ncbi:MAG: rhamnulokinase family protein [Micrococcales bacterium]
MSKLYAAIDLGASSGRVIAGSICDASVNLFEVHRFANTPIERGKSLYWDFESLKIEVAQGLRLLGDFAQREGHSVASIGVDTWAVDYGLIDDAGNLIDGVRSYRDERNLFGVALVDQVISFEDLYRENGIQFLQFNTIYQLAAEQSQSPEALNRANKLLMVPDLLNYWLTGVAVSERTNASTTGLLSLESHGWNWSLIELLGIRAGMFPDLVSPGEVIGNLLDGFKTNSAFSETVVIATPSHDTAAAVAGTPLLGESDAYLSSGTWSLLGLELNEAITSTEARLENFTNEQGAENRVRFLKNLSGLWLLQQSMLEFEKNDPAISLQKLLQDAALVESDARIEVTDSEFATPGDMPAKIQTACARRGNAVPQSPAQIVRCILDSLADAYAKALKSLERVTGIRVKSIYIVGGGSQNDLLSQLTADSTGVKVWAGPVEATALGNILCQAGAQGFAPKNLDAQRQLIRANFSPKVFTPKLLGTK